MHIFENILYKIYCLMPSNKYGGVIKRLEAKIACEGNYNEHFWHDGCPYCDDDIGQLIEL